MALTVDSLIALAQESEAVLRNCGAGAPQADADLVWDYAMYRLGDNDFWAVGFTWTDSVGRRRSAKVRLGVVTDHYEIYGHGGDYFSAEIDPVTNEVLALYRNDGNDSEPKISTTGETLQQNTYCNWRTLPPDYLKDLRAIHFVGLSSVYCWANKPYGRCVEFAIGNLQP